MEGKVGRLLSLPAKQEAPERVCISSMLPSSIIHIDIKKLLCYPILVKNDDEKQIARILTAINIKDAIKLVLPDLPDYHLNEIIKNLNLIDGEKVGKKNN